MSAEYVPRRGDVVWLTLDPQAGHEQAGRRPVVVVSATAYNRRVGMALVCPVTSQQKGYPFEVPLPAKLPVAGVVLSDHLKNLDWQARRAEFICSLPADTLQDISKKIRALLKGD